MGIPETGPFAVERATCQETREPLTWIYVILTSGSGKVDDAAPVGSRIDPEEVPPGSVPLKLRQHSTSGRRSARNAIALIPVLAYPNSRRAHFGAPPVATRVSLPPIWPLTKS